MLAVVFLCLFVKINHILLINLCINHACSVKAMQIYTEHLGSCIHFHYSTNIFMKLPNKSIQNKVIKGYVSVGTSYESQ